MKYSDTTNKNGIIQRCEDYINQTDAYISGDATRLKRFTAYANEELSRVWHLIFESSGNWKFDDSNYTDLPSAETDLEDGTAKYTLPSDALTIQRVEVLDEDGNETTLTPLTMDDIKVAVDEFKDVDSIPTHYRLFGDVIELFPAPNYDKTDGLVVYFDRAMDSFATSDTTQQPGFASVYHEIIPIGMALKWLKIKTPESNQIPQLEKDYQRINQELMSLYSRRFKSYRQKVSRKRETYK